MSKHPQAISEAFGKVDWPKNFCSSTTGVAMLGLMSAIRARVCIEIGVYEGFTTACIGHGLAAIGGGTLISSELYQSYADKCKLLLQDVPGVRHIVITGDSRKVDWARTLQDAGESQACLAYVDGDHSYEMAQHDINAVAPLIRPGGLIVVHDYNTRFMGVVNAVNEFVKAHGWRLIILPNIHEFNAVGSAVIQRPMEVDQ